MEKIWNKFHPVFGADLKVGFETTFLKGKEVILDPLYEKSGLVHNSPKESVKRIYEPAKVLGSCKDGKAVQVFFEPVPPLDSLFRRLVFARKIEHFSRKPRRWMITARHGEPTHFGFDSWNSRNERYLSLVYTGLNGQFIPIYVKIRDGKEEKGEEFTYLEVWAWDDDGKVVVQARRVSEKETFYKLQGEKRVIFMVRDNTYSYINIKCFTYKIFRLRGKIL